MNNKKVVQVNANKFIVYDNNKYLTCDIKGKLKYGDEKITPVVGDNVEINTVNNENIIIKVEPRKNYIIRPRIANIDKIFVLQSIVQPNFNFKLLMKYLAYYEYYLENVGIIFTKSDLLKQKEKDNFIKYYNALKTDGYEVHLFSKNENTEEFNSFKNNLKNQVFCLAGNSGVGKSTFINRLIPNLNLKTQAISHALNRGKHTTTTSRILVHDNYLIIDTPGFSSIDINLLSAQQFAKSYHDFKDASLKCKFFNCLHLHEPCCYVKKLVDENKISLLRYEMYCEILKEIQNA